MYWYSECRWLIIPENPPLLLTHKYRPAGLIPCLANHLLPGEVYYYYPSLSPPSPYDPLWKYTFPLDLTSILDSPSGEGKHYVT